MRDKPEIIFLDDHHSGQPRLYKIIRLFTDVNYNRNERKENYCKEKSGKEFFEYVPVDFLDHAVKVMVDER